MLKAHVPIETEEGPFCSACGLEIPIPNGGHLVRDIATEIKQTFPTHPNAGPRKGLGSDPQRAAYDLAWVGLSNTRKQIVQLQKRGGILAVNDQGVQLEIISANNQIAPATKNHLRGTDYQHEKLKLENVRFEAQKIIARLLEEKGIRLDSQQGLDLGAKIIRTWNSYFADAVTKITLQDSAKAQSILTETNGLPLILELCARAFSQVMEA